MMTVQKFTPRLLKSTKARLIGVLCMLVVGLLTCFQLEKMSYLDGPQQLQSLSLAISDHLLTTTTTSATNSSSSHSHPTCAINLYGLPRAFQSLVLPSLIHNVIAVNPTCDYFMHFYHQQSEGRSRSGTGGKLDAPETIQSLFQQAVHRINPHATVLFQMDTETTYQQALANRNIQQLSNQLFLRKSDLQRNQSVDLQTLPGVYWNILKMWHSQEAVWNLMEEYTTHSKQNNKHQQPYEYVAMLRNDVFYASPVNILDQHNQPGRPKVAIPGFGKMPLSDRMIYGPRKAAQLWATNRISLANNDTRPPLGRGGDRFKDGKLDMSSDEIYLQRFIMPRIQEEGFDIVEHPSICFFRARAEEVIWVSDCFNNASPSVKSFMLGIPKKDLGGEGKTFALNASQHMRGVVEGILQRPCRKKMVPIKLTNTFFGLSCPANMRRKSALERTWRSVRKTLLRKWI